MVVAPGGGKELALAMRRHADGVRNMMQSELVPSFQNAIDRIMEQRVVDVLASVQRSLDTQMDMVQQVLNAHREDAARLGKLERGHRRHAKRIGALEANNTRLDALEAEVRRLAGLGTRGDGKH